MSLLYVGSDNELGDMMLQHLRLNINKTKGLVVGLAASNSDVEAKKL